MASTAGKHSQALPHGGIPHQIAGRGPVCRIMTSHISSTPDPSRSSLLCLRWADDACAWAGQEAGPWTGALNDLCRGLYQKRSTPDEGRGVLELPAHDGVPLVELHGKITVGPDPLRVARVHHRLTGGPDGDGALQVAVACPRDPCHLQERGCKITEYASQKGGVPSPCPRNGADLTGG